jgi:hypothetical protein
MWDLEKKYDLLNFEIEGVKPWQAHRVEIYYLLGKKFGIFEKELQRGMNKIKKIRSALRLLKNSILYNPLYNLKQVDYLIFSHPRSKKVNGEWIDIYTKYFIDEIKDKNSFLEFEEHFNGKHLREYKPYKRYLDYISLIRNIKKPKILLSISQHNFLNELNQVLNIDIKSLLIQRTQKFLVTYPIYKEILQKTSPKKIYLVVSYGRSELIKAAKDLKIETIEFQHGTFSRYHLGYFYPNSKQLDYFPDKFLVWNIYWKNLIKFPCEVEIYPFKYLENERKKYQLRKNKNQLIVLGQGGLTDRMAEKILNNLEKFKNYKILFKLHPNEYGKVKSYKNLVKLQKKLNIEILENVDLYKYLAESEYQAGVFSTALYEGVEFGCKTILFDLPGIEYMDKFIEMYRVEVL